MDDPIKSLDRPGNRSAQARYVFFAALTGILTGTVGSYFHLIIDALMTWPQKLGQYITGTSLIIAAALFTMCCTILAAFIVRRFAPEAGGSGVQEIEGAMEGLREVRWRRVLPVKFLMGITSISSGLVLGREGPTIHIGASLGAAITDFFKVSETERRGILAAGAAAGLACAFNAPLAGVLFIVEETHKQFPYTFRTYMGVIAAALLATVMTQIIGGTAPDMSMPEVKAALEHVPAFVLLGCLLGFVGVALNGGIMWAVNFAATMHNRVPYLYPAIIGLCVGALFIVLPYSVTGGEHIIMEIAHQKTGLALLLLLAFARYFTMVGSYSSGVPGGIFAPMLTLATCIGLAFAGIISVFSPEAGIMPLAFAIAAMGGLFTASVRAPIVGVVLTLELTGAYGMTMPLIATCLTANLVAQWIGGKPIYEQLLDRTLAQAGIKPKDRSAESRTGLA
ncbi:H(+)/Cl(-) exchange transporter ClcA [Brucella pseudogrignonensis]|uniref:H(+)/Cl(-) exchange transporter ClcA n=1 Tax=Brucella pseudogrignonensis TaxID=419475 RepID=UPI0028BC065A|nr:H(+)/Cl(-) exchange transporter ClcA [Brucella pseudogrignonensis]MDT6940244.1 H(+)/Cl(-) exchange transporter ClcA [Brucella pseudogrignonensis]